MELDDPYERSVAEDILELCGKRPGLSLTDVVMADGVEEERKPEHFRRKLTLRVEPPPKEYSNDEFLPLPDPEEREEDAADELLDPANAQVHLHDAWEQRCVDAQV